MTVSKKEHPMQTASSVTLKLPRPAPNEDKGPLQVEIDNDLHQAMVRELNRQNKEGGVKGDRNRLTKRAVVEWGIRRWLLESNPAEARRLGIKPA